MEQNSEISNNAVSSEENSGSLQRKLGLWSVISLGVGATIGTGIFSTLSEVSDISGSGLILILAFLIGGLLQIPSNFVYAELASAYPEDGGYYVYIRESGSRRFAFLCGWASFWAIDPPSLSIIALGFVNYLSVFLKIDETYLRFIAIAVIIFFMLIHIRTVKGGGLVQAFLTTLKILPFLLIIGVGIFFMNPDLMSSLNPISGQTNIANPDFFATLFLAVSATTFSFDGMYAASYMSGEVKNPSKVMPIGLIATAVIILVLYFGLTFVSCGLVDINDIANSSAPIATVASKIPIIGEFAGPCVTVMALLVILGSLSSLTMYQPRLQYAMAKDGYFFKSFGKVHPKYNSPYGAIILNSLFSIVLTFVGDLSNLLAYFTIIVLIKNFFAVGSIFYLRKKETYNPSYRCPWGYFMPIVSCFTTLVIIVSTFISKPVVYTIIIAGVILTGLIAFQIWNKKNKSS